MTQPDAFLQAILEAPDDDGLRLAYADYLEERGETARAEFIRLQVTLASDLRHHGHRHCSEKACVHTGNPCETAALRSREKELLERHRGSWTAGMAPGLVMDAWSLDEPMVPYAYGARVRFRRGFVESVTLPAAAFIAHGDAMTAAAPIRAVRLTTQPHVVSWGSARGRMQSHLAGRSVEREFPAIGVLHSEIILTLLRAEWPRVKTWDLPHAPAPFRDGLDRLFSLHASGITLPTSGTDWPDDHLIS